MGRDKALDHILSLCKHAKPRDHWTIHWFELINSLTITGHKNIYGPGRTRIGAETADRQHELTLGRRNEGEGANRVEHQLTAGGDTTSCSGPPKRGSRRWGKVEG